MKFAPIIFLITMCLIGSLALWQKNQPAINVPFEPYALPQISVPLLDDVNQQLTNANFPTDTPFLLHILASWCPSCIGEHGYLMQLQGRHQLAIYAIAWNDSEDNMIKWLNRYGDFYTKVALDKNGITGISLGISGTPETLLVQNGTVLYHHKGPIDSNVWQQSFAPYFEAK